MITAKDPELNETAGLEERLRGMFRAATDTVEESPDLFARVVRSLDEQRARVRFRLKVAAGCAVVLGLIAAVFVASSELSPQYTPDSSQQGRWNMHWWILELVTTLLLVVLAVVLGPLIKRFGKSYAADVFRANPRTGKSYIVLTDVAYYLLFGAYILFTTTFELPPDWRADSIVGAQLKHEVSRLGGIMLIIGALHCANIVLLPMIGRLFTLNRHLEDGDGVPPGRAGAGPNARSGAGEAAPMTATMGGGTWILRIEPAPTDLGAPGDG